MGASVIVERVTLHLPARCSRKKIKATRLPEGHFPQEFV